MVLDVGQLIFVGALPEVSVGPCNDPRVFSPGACCGGSIRTAADGAASCSTELQRFPSGDNSPTPGRNKPFIKMHTMDVEVFRPEFGAGHLTGAANSKLWPGSAGPARGVCAPYGPILWGIRARWQDQVAGA